MEGNKKWWTSKTLWSDVVTIAVGVYGVVKPILEGHGIHVPEIPPSILTILGGMGIYGRMTATQKIG